MRMEVGGTRDVRNSNLISVRFLKKTLIRFGMGLVPFGLKKFGLVRIL